MKDSSADLGVNSKIVQDSLVCLSIFWYFWEKIKKHNFLYSEHLRQNSPKVNQNYYWLWVFFGLSISNCQIRITVLNYTVSKMNGFLWCRHCFENNWTLGNYAYSWICIFFCRKCDICMPIYLMNIQWEIEMVSFFQILDNHCEFQHQHPVKKGLLATVGRVCTHQLLFHISPHNSQRSSKLHRIA